MHNQRSNIVDGCKPEKFLGLSRGGYGNPFNVTTPTGNPLAADMASALATALRDAGHDVKTTVVKPATTADGARAGVIADSGASKAILIRLVEWKTDTMARTGLDFDVVAEVLDANGNVLATNRVSGKEVSGASILSADKDSRKWFEQKMTDLLSNREIAAQLR